MLSYRHVSAAIALTAMALQVASAQPVPASPDAKRNASTPASSSVPNMGCGRDYSPTWDNCIGAVRYPNGNIYRGEYHHGMREGFGFIVINAQGVSDKNSILSNEQSIYAGEFRGDRLNGHGVWFTKSGAGYAGTFVDNIPQSDVSRQNCTGDQGSWSHCVATVRYGNGNLYRGEFMQGQREGIGMLEIRATGVPDSRNIRTPAPGIYVGNFKGGRLNGRGMIFIPGAGFYGTFKDNLLGSASATSHPAAPPVTEHAAAVAQSSGCGVHRCRTRSNQGANSRSG